MNDHKFLQDYFSRYRAAIFGSDISENLIVLRNLMIQAREANHKTIIAGNGGSAAIASHCAVDFSKNAKTRCVNFNVPSLVTCLANDYGYERWLEKAFELYSDDGDLAILISSSGQSENMLRAAEYAQAQGLPVVTFTGFSPDNPLQKYGTLNFWVDSKAYNIVEMTHQIWLLAVCDLIIGAAEYSAS